MGRLKCEQFGRVYTFGYEIVDRQRERDVCVHVYVCVCVCVCVGRKPK